MNLKELEKLAKELKQQEQQKQTEYLQRRLKPKPTDFSQQEGAKIEIPID